MRNLCICLFFLFPGISFYLVVQQSSVAERKIPLSEQKKTSGALEALQWISKTRAYPNAEMPRDGYARALNQMHARFDNPAETFAGSWTNIGPTNIGGRTLCLAIDPNDTLKLWMGSASGGLWKSVTGGIGPNPWTYVPIGFPVLGISTIAINPQNTNEMYIGTGETYNYGNPLNGLTDRTTRGTVGMGIFKTTDGGATWTQALNWTYENQRGVWEIEINPLRPQTVFAATTEGVYKSTDAGQNWAQVLTVTMCMDVALHNSDTSVVMCGAGNLNSANKGLYRSTDGGLNWALVTNGFPNTPHTGRIQIALYAANNDMAVAELCDMFNTIGFYKTTDKGASWTAMSSQDITGYQGWYCEGLLIKPDDQNIVLAGGIEVYRSSDGGGSFIPVSDWTTYMPHADVHELVANPQNPNSVYVITDGGLFLTYDYGDNYIAANEGYVTTQCYIGSISRTDPNFILVGLQDNNTIAYAGFPYWYPVLGGDGSWNAIDPTYDDVSYCSYQYLNVYQSLDHAMSYYPILNYPSSSTGGNAAAFLAPFVIAPSDNSRLYAGEQALVRSDDMGMSFSIVSPMPVDPNSNHILCITVSETNEDSVYITTSADNGPMHVMLSTDGGFTFSDRSAGLPNRYPRRLTVDPRNSKIAYVVFSGFGTGHIYKTTDAGITWNDVSVALPDVPFHCLAVDPQYPDIIYAGSDIGLFVSLDAGATWTAHNTGLPEWAMVFDLVVSYSDRMLHAFTHGNGVWKRSLDDVLAIDDANEAELTFGIFPNPASDVVTISFAKETKQAEITVFDLRGKMMLTRIIKDAGLESSVAIDVSEWPAGCYLVRLINDGVSHTKRLFVNSK